MNVHLCACMLLLPLYTAARFPPACVISEVNEWLACMASDAVVVAASGWDMRNTERKGCGEGGEGGGAQGSSG